MATVEPVNFDLWPWQYWRQRSPNATAIVLEQQNITWRELCDHVSIAQQQLVNHFVHLQICALQVGLVESSAHPPLSIQRIAINSDGRYENFIIMLASWQQGWQTLMLNSALSQSERAILFKQVGIDAFFSLDVFPLHFAIENKRNQEFALYKPVFDKNTFLTLTLTSGSSDLPKAVVHSARHHLASATGLLHILPYVSDDCWLLSLPLFHVSGLAIVWRWLSIGARLKIAEIKGDRLISAIEGVTHASFVPPQLQRVLNSKLSTSLHSVLLGGVSISQALVDEAEYKGIQCWCGYGMTEMASTITAKRADGRFTVGNVLPNRALYLTESGEVLVKGETLSPGYMVGGVLQALNADWLATKDKGQWCKTSCELQLIGRLDNMFICGGENVQPEAVERMLSVYPKLTQVIILPVEDGRWGSVPIAIVKGNIDFDVFLHWAQTQVPAYQCPVLALQLPEDIGQSGIKLSRKALADWLAKQVLSF
ncbi:AMP-binding protein [Candidatus Enterovibrio altilux]|uniref:O-succinylbenzoic acid--CoA ligase n=1 Tax=Candidatus Enterovibrio altilux TaxID=1927128 RepID=A0A291BAC1_9GAMM|nr:AMP-binding protein [Candidatus Enterovibrio luxaltus]ATF09935.1 O-succinylbenzoic acid--CoA ligase [Candidatus Enterovibrio luxaltus]